MLGEAPAVIPDGLQPEDYLELGNWYHQEKKLEHARKCWQFVLELESEGESAESARFKLDEHIPAREVPYEAIEVFRNLALTALSSPGKAKKEHRSLIEKHPDFEWPYVSLAELIIRNEGDLQQARSLLDRAFEINPDYSRALITMAQLLMVGMDYDGAAVFIEKARAAMPTNDEIDPLRRAMETLSAYD